VWGSERRRKNRVFESLPLRIHEMMTMVLGMMQLRYPVASRVSWIESS